MGSEVAACCEIMQYKEIHASPESMSLLFFMPLFLLRPAGMLWQQRVAQNAAEAFRAVCASEKM